MSATDETWSRSICNRSFLFGPTTEPTGHTKTALLYPVCARDVKYPCVWKPRPSIVRTIVRLLRRYQVWRGFCNSRGQTGVWPIFPISLRRTLYFCPWSLDRKRPTRPKAAPTLHERLTILPSATPVLAGELPGAPRTVANPNHPPRRSRSAVPPRSMGKRSTRE